MYIVSTSEEISIHALRVEGDRQSAAAKRWKPYFYPRPPSGGRLEQYPDICAEIEISIHALRVEGDKAKGRITHEKNISIHALRVEGDFFCFDIIPLSSRFLSTPSEWRATGLVDAGWRPT